MRIIRKIAIALILSFLFWAYSLADEPLIVDASGSQKCDHGLHPQPNDGPFTVLLFCDDALGSNIGIILIESSADPGKIELNEQKVWSHWNTVNRFWQDGLWSADVVHFEWSPSQRYPYVATRGVYGDGGFFKRDLREHSSQRLIPRANAPYTTKLAGGYYTRIQVIDLKKRKITVAMRFMI